MLQGVCWNPKKSMPNIMYRQDAVLQGTQQNVGADNNNATSKDVELNVTKSKPHLMKGLGYCKEKRETRETETETEIESKVILY